jgi:outer membrane scaffolding protein for murein synthesis (MipA/OmpV family)
MEDMYKKTAYVGTNLENDQTQWVAFPVVKLDGKNPRVVISAERYELGYTDFERNSYPVNPTNGVFFLKAREAFPNGDGPQSAEASDAK